MADQFAQFGGQAADSTPPDSGAADPFAQFGGMSAKQPVPPPAPSPTNTTSDADQFRQFGGVPASQPTTPTQPSGPDPFAALGGVAAQPDEYQQIHERINQPFFKSLSQSPLLHTESMTDSEIEAIAKQHGVDPESLKNVATFYGASRAGQEGAENTLGQLGSSVTRASTFGIPQFIYKKAQEPKFRDAIDDLRELANSKRSYLQGGAELALPIVETGLTGGGNLAGAALTGAAVGGAFGLTGSREGQEATGAAAGAGLGAGLGVAGHAAVEGISRLLDNSGASTQAEKLLQNENRNIQSDIAGGAQKIAEDTKPSEDLIRDSVLDGKDLVDRDDIDTILQEQLSPEALDKYLTPGTEESKLVGTTGPEGQVTEGAPLVKERIAEQIVEDRRADLAQSVSGRAPKNDAEAQQMLDEYASRQGGMEALQAKYEDLVAQKQAERYIQESGSRATDDPGFFHKAANFISDPQFIYRNIDERFGTRLQQVQADLNRDYNRSTFASSAFKEKAAEASKLDQASGVARTIQDSDKIYNALDTGNTAGLSPQEIAAAARHRAFFNNIRDFANGTVREGDPHLTPLSIPYTENYVPKMPVKSQEMLPLLEQRMQQSLDIASKQTGRAVTDLAELSPQEYRALQNAQPFRELSQAATLFDKKGMPATGAEMSSRLKELMYTRQGNIALESSARAAEGRMGAIPDFLLEKNLYELERRYTDNTIRHLFLRRDLDQMANQARLLDKMGADVHAQYVKNNIQDLLGVRKGTAAEAMLQLKMQSYRYLDQLEKSYGSVPGVHGVLSMAKAVPEWLSYLSSKIYENTMGYSLRSVIHILEHAPTKLVPELGYQYGPIAMTRGAVYAMKNLPQVLEKVKSMGLIPNSHAIRAGEAGIVDGIRATSLYKLPAATIEAVGKAGMVLVQASEKFNRALAVGTGEMMAHDLSPMASPAMRVLATKGLEKFPVYLRQTIIEHADTPAVTSQLITKYLSDATMYNYNRVSMAEFGRSLGPMFSVFSKWPTATAGDMIYHLRSRGVLGSVSPLVAKYMTPFLLMKGVGYMLDRNNPDNMSDRQKMLVGSTGLEHAAPMMSVGGFITGHQFSPPAINAIHDALLRRSKGDQTLGEKIKSGVSGAANSYVQTFAPGAGLTRFLTDDLITYITGHRPEGNNFLERTQNGIRRILK